MPTKDKIEKGFQLAAKDIVNIVAPIVGAAGASVALGFDSHTLQTGAFVATGLAAATSGGLSVLANIGNALAIDRKCNSLLKKGDNTIEQQARRNFRSKHEHKIKNIKIGNIAFQALYAVLLAVLAIAIIVTVFKSPPLIAKILMIINTLIVGFNGPASALFSYLWVTPKSKALAKEILNETITVKDEVITNTQTLYQEAQRRINRVENDKELLKEVLIEKNGFDNNTIFLLLNNKENIRAWMSNNLSADSINPNNINREIFNPNIIDLLVKNLITYDDISRLSQEGFAEIAKDSRCYYLLSKSIITPDDLIAYTPSHINAINSNKRLDKLIKEGDLDDIYETLLNIKNKTSQDNQYFFLPNANDSDDESPRYSY